MVEVQQAPFLNRPHEIGGFLVAGVLAAVTEVALFNALPAVDWSGRPTRVAYSSP